MPDTPTKSKNYFLNERHELSVSEKIGGGRPVEYLNINWPQKARKLHTSLLRVQQQASISSDPLRNRHYYIIAAPVAEIVKASAAKDATDGKKTEKVAFNGEQSRVFERIGLDLIEVHTNGSATVHATPERLNQLINRTEQLSHLGKQEQSRFVAFESFSPVEAGLKYDEEWTRELGVRPHESYIQLHPLVNSIEADTVFHTLSHLIKARHGLSIRGIGRSYGGRFFLRANLTSQAIRQIAEEFTSVQSIHPPIDAFADSLPMAANTPMPEVAAVNALSLPIVGVVDTATPSTHPILSPYRTGIVTGKDCLNMENDNHGSMVASRIVFGDFDLNGATTIIPSCRFLEVRVASEPNKIRMESVVGALSTAISTAPNVRVFNLSFDAQKSLEAMTPKYRAETIKQIEELDNFAFDNDVALVIAAGNVTRGIIPTPPYPNHFDDSNWKLHSISRAFNAITCGGTAGRLLSRGLASNAHAPSPFCRIGPGFAQSPKPDLCASAGNTTVDHAALPGGGVWGFSALAYPIQDYGTSFASPIVARELAFILEELRRWCPGDARPFACTAKAVLALTAYDPLSHLDPTIHPLAKRTLGYGYPSSQSFIIPQQSRARFIWQGIIENEGDVVRVQLPMPRDWIDESTAPVLRIVAAWDTPVSAAVEQQWACRDVEIKIKPGPDAKALHGSKGRIHGYPLMQRTWKLERAREKGLIESDQWVVEFSYNQIAAYASGHNPPPTQRIAMAAEIWDESEEPLEPHSFIQKLPIAATLVILSGSPTWIPQPITVTSTA